MDISRKPPKNPKSRPISHAKASVTVMDLPICKQTRTDCEAMLARILSHPSASPTLIFTPNAEMMLAAHRDPALRRLLKHADLLLPDGIGTRILSCFRVKERLPGIEMGEFLLSYSAKHSLRVFLLGGKPGVAFRAVKMLRDRYPGLRIVGTHHGYFEADSEEEHAILNVIRKASPDLLIVCTGFPRQEKFLAKHRGDFPSVRIGIGLGGALDVWAGDIRRAPLLFRRCGLEWLWRLAREPKRIPRFFGNLIGFPPRKD